MVIFRAMSTVETPPVPKWQPYPELAPDHWEDHWDEPSYVKDLERAQVDRQRVAIETVIDQGVRLVDSLPDDNGWRVTLMRMSLFNGINVDLSTPEAERRAFLIYGAIADGDMAVVAQYCVITDQAVERAMNAFNVMRHETPIKDVKLSSSINTGIGYGTIHIGGLSLTSPMDERRACIAANANWVEWARGKYSHDEKIEMLALHRLHILEEMHKGDAQQQAAKSK